jgi:hypothetical protein
VDIRVPDVFLYPVVEREEDIVFGKPQGLDARWLVFAEYLP